MALGAFNGPLPDSRQRVSTATRFVNSVPLFISYAILVGSWAGFVPMISIHEVFLRRGETWHFIEQQLIFNVLFILTILSLYTASHRGPGAPDTRFTPESVTRPVSAAPTEPKDIEDTLDTEDDENIPLRYLKNSQWVTTRISKDRHSPLPLGVPRQRDRATQRGTSSERSSPSSDGSTFTPFPFLASPFVPRDIDETGEDEEDAETDRSEDAVSVASDVDDSRTNGETDDLSSTHEGTRMGSAEQDEDKLLPDRPGVGPVRRSIMVKSNTGGPRWCKKCDVWKPDRSHHCRHCHSCSLKMDHHCIWVGSCVGYRNYKPFILFVTYGTLLSIYGTLEAGYETFRFFREPEAFYTSSNDCPEGSPCSQSEIMTVDLGPVVFMIIAILGAFFALSVGGLAGYHWWLACNNVTTLEHLTHSFPSVLLSEEGSTPNTKDTQWRPDHLLTREERIRLRREARAINVYDLGWKHNLRQVFGEGWLRPLWPLSLPDARYRHDGGHYFEVDEGKLDRLKELTRELRYGMTHADGADDDEHASAASHDEGGWEIADHSGHSARLEGSALPTSVNDRDHRSAESSNRGSRAWYEV